MSENKIIQIFNEKEQIIESIDITDKKLDSFELLKRFVSSKLDVKNKKLEYFIVDYFGNKIPINSENEYKNNKNIHLFKIKITDLIPKKCEKHPKDNLIHFCYDCNEEFCGTCFIKEPFKHQYHRLVDLESYKEIRQIISQNEDQLNVLINGINECDLIIDSLKENRQKFLETLQKIFDNIKNEYDKYIYESNEKIENIKRKYKRDLDFRPRENEFFDILDKDKYNELKNIEEIKSNLNLTINKNDFKNDINNLIDYINNMKEINNNNYKNFQKIIDNQDIFRTKIIKYNNGSKYIGEVKNNQKIEGKGILYWPDGSKYEGEFKNNKRDGRGIFYWSNGSKYEGEFKNNKMEGNGILYLQDGSKYEGEFKDGKRNGRGVYYFKDSKITIENYENGVKIGKSISLLPDGNYEIKEYK